MLRRESEAYEKATQLAKEIVKECAKRKITLKEFSMLKTALPIEIDKKINEVMLEEQLN